MENASEALLMAGQVLIFIIALTVCMSSFTTVRTGIDGIIGQTETVELARGSDGYINYLESNANKATRVVGAETVVSSMCRAIKENYVVYVGLKDQTAYDSELSDVDYIVLKKPIKIKGSDGAEQIKIDVGKKVIKTTIGQNTNQNINEKLASGLYKYIKDKSFLEYLGEYQTYTASDSGVTPENKQTYRIITYIEQ